MTPRVAIIGAGGLGGPLAYALAAAGAHLTICDDDVVELSNLQRQVQFAGPDVGRRKVDALGDELCRRGYPRAALRLVAERFTTSSAERILGLEDPSADVPVDPWADSSAQSPPDSSAHDFPLSIDVVVDGSDDFACKFAVNDLAMARGLPFVIASALQYTGQIFALDPNSTNTQGCYRCMFEAPPDDPEESAQTCANAGVLGATVGVVGALAAQAVLRLALGSAPLPGRDRPSAGLWTLDDIRAPVPPDGVCGRTITYHPRPECPACAHRQRIVGSAISYRTTC